MTEKQPLLFYHFEAVGSYNFELNLQTIGCPPCFIPLIQTV